MPPSTPFELRPSPIAGTGAFATRRIRSGERIIEYTGERIDDDEATRRYDDEEMETHHTFLFSVGDDVNIDARVGGNDSRFINHSCGPNCEAIEDDGRIFICATRAIAAGEELTYDYQYARGEGDELEEDRYPCHCGAPTCRGTILAPRKEPKRRPRSGKTNTKATRGKVKSVGSTVPTRTTPGANGKTRSGEAARPKKTKRRPKTTGRAPLRQR